MTTPAIIFPKLTKLSRLRSWRVLLALLLAGTATLASAQPSWDHATAVTSSA